MTTCDKKTRIVFWGTPEFALPFLSVLVNEDQFTVIAVVTQPDKPAGRKKTPTPPPLKILAAKNQIEILQPISIKNNPAIIQRLRNLKPDLFVVVAFGEIMPPEILAIPKFGAINVHPSLLPKYRGASPIQSAIINGDDETGVTIILMDAKMDHGPILAQQKIRLDDAETNVSLHQNLAEQGKKLLIETMKKFITGDIKPIEQDHAKAIYCREIKRKEAKINWSEPAENIERKIRAYYPWPAAWTTWQGKRIKIFPPTEVKKTKEQENKKTNGSIGFENNKLIIKCGEDFLTVNKLQIEGKKENSAPDFVRGNQKIIGHVLAS